MHVAIVCHDLTSRLTTSLELARRLQDAGHDVTYVTHADVGEVVRSRGHAFHQLEALPLQSERFRPPSLTDMPSWMRRARAQRRATAAEGEIERTMVEIDPDVLLVDIEMHYPVIALSHLGIPILLYMNFFSIFRSDTIPPMDSPLIPTGGPGDATRIRRAWRRTRWRIRSRRIQRKFGRALAGDLLRPISYATYHYADVKAVAKARGYDLPAHTSRRMWLEPVMFTDIPILSFTAREMEFPHDVHPSMRYVGPMIPFTRPESRTTGPDARRWQQFVHASVELPGPIVYCSLGSYQTDVDFLSRVIDVFRNRPDWRLVIGLGGQARIEDLGHLPPNVLALTWAPQLDVLAMADAAIIHGGSSSVHECIANEVPMLVYPMDPVLDRHGNAARVDAAGLGLRGSFSSDDAAQIEERLSILLADDERRRRLSELRMVFDRYRKDEVAVRTVEHAAGMHPPD